MEAIHAVAVAVAILTAEVEGEDIMGVEAGIAVEEEEEVTEVSDIFTHTTHTHTHTQCFYKVSYNHAAALSFFFRRIFKQIFRSAQPSVKLIYIIRPLSDSWQCCRPSHLTCIYLMIFILAIIVS